MAIDVGIGDLIGSLFFGGDIIDAAADAAPAALDLGITAADVAPAAADLGVTVAADALPVAADLGGATAVGADALGADAGVTAALDAGAQAGAATGDLTGDTLAALDLAGTQDLGTQIGGAVGDVGFIPTAADTGVATQGLGATGLPGTSSGVPAGASALGDGGVTSPITDLTTGPQNLNAALGTTPTAPPTDVTTSQFAADAAPPVTNMGSDVSVSANDPFIGPLNAAGGLSSAPGVGDALASAPAGAGAAAGSGSVLSTIGSVASNPLVQLGVPAGMLAYNLLKGPAPIPPQAQQAVNNAQANLAPLQNASTQNIPLFNQTASTDLNLANSFQISPAQAASIDVWKQNQYNALRQQIANQNPGSPNVESSSEWVQGKNQIDQQALAMQVQMINQLISTAFQAASAANAAVSTSANVTAQFDATLMQAAQLQVQQDTNFQNAVGSAMQAFGLIAGLNAGKFANRGSTPAGGSA